MLKDSNIRAHEWCHFPNCLGLLSPGKVRDWPSTLAPVPGMFRYLGCLVGAAAAPLQGADWVLGWDLLFGSRESGCRVLRCS